MKKVYLFLLVVLVTCTLANAATYSWSGSAGNWSDGANWKNTADNSTGVVPGANDDVVFANTTTATVTLDFSSSTAVRSITVGSAANVIFTTNSIRTINLGAVASCLVIPSGRSLTLVSSVASNYITVNIPTGGSCTIAGQINFAQSTTTVTGQQNQLIGVDAGSIIINGTVLSGVGNSNPFGTSSINNNVVVFKSGSKFTSYTNTSPWGSAMTAPNQICNFEQGSTYQIFGGTGFPGFGGRTLGTLQLSGGNNGGISNATANTTTILDSLIITATSGSNVTFSRGSGGSAVPTFSFNNIRISATATSNTPVVFSNNGIDNATYVISGGVIVNTASAATGNASLTLGNSTVNTSNTTTSITFSGNGKSITTEDQGAGTGVPSITFATSGTSNTGNKVTNLIIDSTANITLNANLDLTTTNITSNLTVRTKGILSIGSGYTLTTNNRLTLQSSVTGTGSIGNSTGATIIGNATVQRYIPANAAWRTIGLPFTSTYNYTGTTAGANEISVSFFAGKTPSWAYYYNDANDDGKYGVNSGSVNAGWTAFNAGTSGINVQKGLLLYGSKNASAQTLSGSGNINYGTVTIPLSKASTNGWNLVANPYPSNISWTSIVANTENASGILASNTVYRVNPLGGGAYSFSSYTAGANTGTNGGSDVIENGAAFFVKAAATTSLTVKESNKTTNATGATTGGVTLMGANGKYSSIRVSLTGDNTNSDEVVFMWGRFNKTTEDFDSNIDAYDLGANGTHDLSIVDNKGVRYSIFNGTDLQKSKEKRKYTLATRNLVKGNYRFAVAIPQAIGDNSEAYLVDNYLGKAVLVKEGLVYSFQVTEDLASMAEQRFSLEIRKK